MGSSGTLYTPRMRTRVNPLTLIFAALLALAAAGCGQKGPLYLPDAKPTPTPAPAPATRPAPAPAPSN